jgi:hypothetical protein
MHPGAAMLRERNGIAPGAAPQRLCSVHKTCPLFRNPEEGTGTGEKAHNSSSP